MSPRGVVGPGSSPVSVSVWSRTPPHPTTGPAARPDSGAPATDWNDRLAAARSEEFTDLFHAAVTEDFGAVARLHQMLETVSEWCRAHGARSSASELDAIASRLTDLGEELRLVGENVGHEIRSRSHRAAAAARLSPAASARGASPGQQSDFGSRLTVRRALAAAFAVSPRAGTRNNHAHLSRLPHLP